MVTLCLQMNYNVNSKVLLVELILFEIKFTEKLKHLILLTHFC